ncbi:MAG: sigma factor-like helix-turn-helix DNA-binding protein [Solirubrobacteraceae bacterium]
MGSGVCRALRAARRLPQTGSQAGLAAGSESGHRWSINSVHRVTHGAAWFDVCRDSYTAPRRQPSSRLCPVRLSRASRIGPGRSVSSPAMATADRVQERRRAAALARHYRDEEGLSIAEIARRLGRAPATVKAYLHDPSDANKGLSGHRVAKAGGREVWSHLPAAASRGETLPRRAVLCARLGGPARWVGSGF